MKRLNIFLFEIIILVVSTTDAFGNTSNLLPDSVIELKKYYDVITNLEKRGIINKDVAAQEKQFYIEHASKLIRSKKLLSEEEFIRWEKEQIVISFSNVAAILAAVTVTISLTILVGMCLLPILVSIPPIIWEILFYILSFYLMLIIANPWLIFFGCLIFLSALSFTTKYHLKTYKYSELIISCTCFFVFATVAVYQQNREAGYLAIIALEASLGFIMLVGELVIIIGFQNEKIVPTGTMASFVLVLIGIVLHTQPQLHMFAVPFTRPALFLGTFVYFIGILILSSRYYTSRCDLKIRFWLLQIIGFVSGLLAIFVGPMLDLPFVQAVGGTMFVIWLLEKYVEIAPWRNTFSICCSLLGFGLSLYGFAYFLKTYPQYFIFSL